MRSFHRLHPALAIAVAGAGAFLAGAAETQSLSPIEKARVALVAERTATEPGAVARLAALMSIESGWHVNSHQPTEPYLIPTELTITVPEGWPAADVAYPPGHLQMLELADEPLSVYDGEVSIIASLPVPATAPAGRYPVTADLTYQACDDSSCLRPITKALTLDLVVGTGGEPTADAGAFVPGGRSRSAGGSARSLGLVLLLGLVGGLILNAMPCVLPVLSLKVFGLVKSAGQGRGAVVGGALATAAGILASFLALAGAAIVAKTAGAAVGWGVQFQNPVFVTFLAIIVVLFCLNLWGLFEITLPGRLAQVGAAGSGGGLGGHFASGLFATLMATPCSAPFLGTAIGFALAQSAPTVLAVFLAVGIGMALPYLLLAVFPGAARWLPKPGAWMETLKGMMGFLLAGAVVWLLYVLSAQVSAVRLAAIELCLLLLALGVWLSRRPGWRPLARRLAVAGTLAVVAGTLALPWNAAAGEGAERAASKKLIDWIPFDEAEAEALADEGRLVFVDVTADWCFTCKVNERVTLETPDIASAFERYGVIAMKADWTNQDAAIGDYLASFGRYGIPFYALYRSGTAPHLFSELLTKGEVLRVLEESATHLQAAGGGDDGGELEPIHEVERGGRPAP